MTTTFAPVFKNSLIDAITGRTASSNGTYLSYVSCYSGSQVADPTTAPAGVFVNTTITQAPSILTFMTASAGGVSQLAASRPSAANANNAATVTTARIFNASQVACIDTTATLAGGGGGVIVPTLTSSTGAAFVIDMFSIKLPNNNGTLFLNDTLRDALITAMTSSVATAIGAGAVATISVYSGSVPASANVAATGTLLWSTTTAATGASWSAAVAGSAALVSSLSAAAVAGAATTATYARITKGAFVIQGTVGTTGTDFIMDSVTLTSGVTYAITNATISI